MVRVCRSTAITDLIVMRVVLAIAELLLLLDVSVIMSELMTD